MRTRPTAIARTRTRTGRDRHAGARADATARSAPFPIVRSVLPSGLRVVTQSMPGARSASVAIFVPVGSRHEDEAHAGLSHLLEHLVFKGTRDHPEPGALSQVVEGVGGSINASTDRELTVYSSKVPAEQLGVALHAVSELALHPVLRRTDLSAEKPVIVDEIRMYVDSPSDHVFTLFDELLYGRHPLGREIAGTIGSVRRATHRGVVDHWRAAYRPARVVLAVAGAIDHEQVLRRRRRVGRRRSARERPARSASAGGGSGAAARAARARFASPAGG